MKITKKYLQDLVTEEIKKYLIELEMSEEDEEGWVSAEDAAAARAASPDAVDAADDYWAAPHSPDAEADLEMARMQSQIDQLKMEMEKLASRLELLQTDTTQV